MPRTTICPANACRLAIVLTLLLASVLTAVSAAAQQTYSLTEDDQWTQVAEPDPATPEGQLALARQALARSDASRALELASQWIDSHERHALVPEAYLLRGDAKAALGNEYQALFDYEYVARRYPGSDVFVPALEREFEIARSYAEGRKRKLWGMRIVDATETAEELLIRIQERLGGSRLAEQAGMALADFYFRRGDMTLAVEAYDLFIENYPRSEQIDKAKRRLIYANLALFKGPEFDPAGLYEARLRLREMQRFEPVLAERIGAEAILTRIDEKNAEKLLTTARYYVRTGNYVSAEFTIRRLLKQYPLSVAATDALRMIPDILQKLPDNVIASAPDYAAYRQALLTESTEQDGADAAAPPAPSDRPAEPEGKSNAEVAEDDENEEGALP